MRTALALQQPNGLWTNGFKPGNQGTLETFSVDSKNQLTRKRVGPRKMTFAV
jgi:hypothetical protein